MLARVLEPEVMDTADEARDYDAMDHGEVNARFCEDLAARGPIEGRVLDVGTGTALIPIQICGVAPSVTIVAIDLAEHMLSLARENVARAGLSPRVTVEKADAKALPYRDGEFAAAVSNSIVHHIPEPRGVLEEMWRVTRPGGLLFVRDLHRPASESEVDRLVQLYGGRRPDDAGARRAFEHQRALFRASLCAALTVDEVVAMVASLGVPRGAVTMTSDRHWTLAVRKP